jgi:4-diphosphocytidyl-2-C-methyl-D-erythritol kinase
MGEGLSGEADNLVLRAAKLLRGGDGKGASLSLTKRLPVAAGLGGGSADAAATLRLLNRLWALGFGPERMTRLAASLGADVPACVASVTASGEGRGDILRPIDAGLQGMPVLLVNPGKAVSTADVFRAWDGVDRGPLGDDWMVARNDLEPIALAMVSEIGEVLDYLRGQSGVRLARMSGSGATCFALFDSDAERDDARNVIAAARPGWWQLASRLR